MSRTDRPATRDAVEGKPPAPAGERAPAPTPPRVTAFEAWGFFLVVIVGIVAGCCVECVDAVQAVVDTFPWHRDI